MDQEELTPDQKKKFICVNIKKLTKEDIVDVAKVIKRNGLDSYIKYNAAGACINLDIIESERPGVINQLYSQINHKLSK